MKKITLFLSALIITLSILPAAQAGNETITLKSGKTYHGDILFSNDQDYVISVDGKAEKVPIVDIERIDFGAQSNS